MEINTRNQHPLLRAWPSLSKQLSFLNPRPTYTGVTLMICKEYFFGEYDD